MTDALYLEALVERIQRRIFLVIDGVARPLRESNDSYEDVQQEQLVRYNTFVEDVIYLFSESQVSIYSFAMQLRFLTGWELTRKIPNYILREFTVFEKEWI